MHGAARSRWRIAAGLAIGQRADCCTAARHGSGSESPACCHSRGTPRCADVQQCCAVALCLTALAGCGGSEAAGNEPPPGGNPPPTCCRRPIRRARPTSAPTPASTGRSRSRRTTPGTSRIDTAQVDPNSGRADRQHRLTTSLHPDWGTTETDYGIPYVVVAGQPRRRSTSPSTTPTRAIPGPYPIPPNAPIEGGAGSSGDRHILMIDRDNWILYELLRGVSAGIGGPAVDGGLGRDLRPQLECAAARGVDLGGRGGAADLPRAGALRRGGGGPDPPRAALHGRGAPAGPTCPRPGTGPAATPAPTCRRWACGCGSRQDFDISGFPAHAQVVLQAMKTYGMIVADNGSNWYVSGVSDTRWDPGDLRRLPPGARQRLRGGEDGDGRDALAAEAGSTSRSGRPCCPRRVRRRSVSPATRATVLPVLPFRSCTAVISPRGVAASTSLPSMIPNSESPATRGAVTVRISGRDVVAMRIAGGAHGRWSRAGERLAHVSSCPPAAARDAWRARSRRYRPGSASWCNR